MARLRMLMALLSCTHPVPVPRPRGSGVMAARHTSTVAVMEPPPPILDGGPRGTRESGGTNGRPPQGVCGQRCVVVRLPG